MRMNTLQCSLLIKLLFVLRENSFAAVPDDCLQEKVSGPCKAYLIKYFFNSTSRACESFVYGGCGANNNNFDTQEACQNRCPSALSDICGLPVIGGPCRSSIPSWFYDSAGQECQPFEYGGCNGNENRFVTKEDCETKCPSAISESTSATTPPPPTTTITPTTTSTTISPATTSTTISPTTTSTTITPPTTPTTTTQAAATQTTTTTPRPPTTITPTTTPTTTTQAAATTTTPTTQTTTTTTTTTRAPTTTTVAPKTITAQPTTTSSTSSTSGFFNYGSGLPEYAIVILVVGVIIVLMAAGFFGSYLVLKKKKAAKEKQKKMLGPEPIYAEPIDNQYIEKPVPVTVPIYERPGRTQLPTRDGPYASLRYGPHGNPAFTYTNNRINES